MITKTSKALFLLQSRADNSDNFGTNKLINQCLLRIDAKEHFVANGTICTEVI